MGDVDKLSEVKKVGGAKAYVAAKAQATATVAADAKAKAKTKAKTNSENLAELEVEAALELDTARRLYALYARQASALVKRLNSKIKEEWKKNYKITRIRHSSPVLNDSNGEIDNHFHVYFDVKKGKKTAAIIHMERKSYGDKWEFKICRGERAKLTDRDLDDVFSLEAETLDKLYDEMVMPLARAKAAGKLEFMGLKPAARAPR